MRWWELGLSGDHEMEKIGLRLLGNSAEIFLVLELGSDGKRGVEGHRWCYLPWWWRLEKNRVEGGNVWITIFQQLWNLVIDCIGSRRGWCHLFSGYLEMWGTELLHSQHDERAPLAFCGQRSGILKVLHCPGQCPQWRKVPSEHQ